MCVCVSAIDFASVYTIFRLDFGNCSDCMVFLFLTLLYRSTWILRTLVIFGIAQCGFLGSITKVIAIEERAKDWSNRECQNKYSRNVKLRVKCLKSIEKERKSSLSKNDKWIQQDQVIRRGKNISKYPPCVFVYAKSVGCVLDTYIFSCIMRRLLCMQIQVFPQIH
jgi:hypothetical protein